MSQISYRFIAPLPALTYPSVRVVQGDALQVAVGKLQGQIDALQATIQAMQNTMMRRTLRYGRVIGYSDAVRWRLARD